MRIFLIISKLNFETAGRSVIDAHLKAKGLAELGHDVTVVTAFSPANNITRKLSYKIREEFINSRGLLGIQRGVYRILRKYEVEADVFYIDGHIFLYGAGFYRLAGGKIPIVAFFNVKLSSWPDRYERLKQRARYFIEKSIGVFLANRLDAFIFNTPVLQKIYNDFGVGLHKSNFLLPDFQDTKEIIQRYSLTKDKIKEQEVNNQIIKIFTVGRMTPESGFDLIIKAFAGIKDKNKYQVMLAGGGQDKERLEKMAEDLNLKQYFIFPGGMDRLKLNEFFLNANIFILPRWRIADGTALLADALTFGLPVIAPEESPFLWLTNGTALTFRNDDIDKLAAQIEKLGSDQNLRIDLASKMLKRAEELDYKNLSEQLEKTINIALRS